MNRAREQSLERQKNNLSLIVQNLSLDPLPEKIPLMRNKNHNKTPSISAKNANKLVLINTPSSKYDNIMNRVKKIQSPKNIIEEIIGRN